MSEPPKESNPPPMQLPPPPMFQQPQQQQPQQQFVYPPQYAYSNALPIDPRYAYQQMNPYMDMSYMRPMYMHQYAYQYGPGYDTPYLSPAFGSLPTFHPDAYRARPRQAPPEGRMVSSRPPVGPHDGQQFAKPRKPRKSKLPLVEGPAASTESAGDPAAIIDRLASGEQGDEATTLVRQLLAQVIDGSTIKKGRKKQPPDGVKPKAARKKTKAEEAGDEPQPADGAAPPAPKKRKAPADAAKRPKKRLATAEDRMKVAVLRPICIPAGIDLSSLGLDWDDVECLIQCWDFLQFSRCILSKDPTRLDVINTWNGSGDLLGSHLADDPIQFMRSFAADSLSKGLDSNIFHLTHMELLRLIGRNVAVAEESTSNNAAVCTPTDEDNELPPSVYESLHLPLDVATWPHFLLEQLETATDEKREMTRVAAGSWEQRFLKEELKTLESWVRSLRAEDFWVGRFRETHTTIGILRFLVNRAAHSSGFKSFVDKILDQMTSDERTLRNDKRHLAGGVEPQMRQLARSLAGCFNSLTHTTRDAITVGQLEAFESSPAETSCEVLPTAEPPPGADEPKDAEESSTPAEQPADSDVPARADSDVPIPADSDVPAPADSDVPIPADSDVPVLTDSDVPVPADSDVPVPAGVPVSANVPVPLDVPIPANVPVPVDVPVPADSDLPVPVDVLIPGKLKKRRYVADLPANVLTNFLNSQTVARSPSLSEKRDAYRGLVQEKVDTLDRLSKAEISLAILTRFLNPRPEPLGVDRCGNIYFRFRGCRPRVLVERAFVRCIPNVVPELPLQRPPKPIGVPARQRHLVHSSGLHPQLLIEITEEKFDLLSMLSTGRDSLDADNSFVTNSLQYAYPSPPSLGAPLTLKVVKEIHERDSFLGLLLSEATAPKLIINVSPAEAAAPPDSREAQIASQLGGGKVGRAARARKRQMEGVPMDDVPMEGVPMDDVPMEGVPLDDVPMDDVPMVDVPGGTKIEMKYEDDLDSNDSEVSHHLESDQPMADVARQPACESVPNQSVVISLPVVDPVPNQEIVEFVPNIPTVTHPILLIDDIDALLHFADFELNPSLPDELHLRNAIRSYVGEATLPMAAAPSVSVNLKSWREGAGAEMDDIDIVLNVIKRDLWTVEKFIPTDDANWNKVKEKWSACVNRATTIRSYFAEPRDNPTWCSMLLASLQITRPPNRSIVVPYYTTDRRDLAALSIDADALERPPPETSTEGCGTPKDSPKSPPSEVVDEDTVEVSGMHTASKTTPKEPPTAKQLSVQRQKLLRRGFADLLDPAIVSDATEYIAGAGRAGGSSRLPDLMVHLGLVELAYIVAAHVASLGTTAAWYVFPVVDSWDSVVSVSHLAVLLHQLLDSIVV